ncbi:MAG: M48 family metallopeptidase [Elusimicrobia bacterium]|nr:M48 family metallopeptidase [Elusimicrobiota bacterium]
MTAKRDGIGPADAEAGFRRLVAAWSKKVHAEPARLRFQKMSRKWASCSAAGQVTFNTALLSQPRKFQEAVIVHELVHLLVPNHGRLFKSMFLSFVPDGAYVLKNNFEGKLGIC